MRIKLSKELHSLITSLSQTEKAYLKKWTLGKSNSKLAIAFDVINTFSEFDERSITSKLKSKDLEPKDIYKRLLPVILKSLNQYHSGSNVELQMHETLISSRILWSKRQSTLALYQIDKAIEIAKEHEYFAAMIDLLGYKQRMHRMEFAPTSNEELENYNLTLEAAQHLQTKIRYEYLYRKFIALSLQEVVTKPLRNEMIEEILNNEALRDENKDSMRNFVLRNRLLAGCNYFVGRWKESIICCNNLLDQMPDFHEGSQSNSLNRLPVFGDLLNLYLCTYNRNGYLKTLKGMDAAQKFSHHFTEQTLYKLQLALDMAAQTDALHTGAIELSIELGDRFLAKHREVSLAPIFRKEAMLKLALAWFYRDEFTKCVQYINTEFLLNESNLLNDIARWLELLCWFHSDDPALFESKWRSWDRHLKKLDSGYEWESWIMKALKQAYGIPFKENQTIIQSLHERLLTVEEELRTRFSGSFDFVLWSESVAIGKSMILVLKERYLND